MSVQRQYYDETFDGAVQGIDDFETNIYASDRGVALASQSPPADYDLVSGLTQDGTYLVTYEFTGGTVDSQNPGFICQFRLIRSGNGSLITVERRTTFAPDFVFEGSGSGSSVYLGPSMDVSVYCSAVAEQPGGVDGMEAKVPGTWNVVRSMSGPISFPPSTVRTFILRLLALKNIRAEEPKFDPKSERNYTEVKADVVALPVGWLPTGNISARLEVSAYGPVNVAIVEQDLTVFAAPGANGEVAEFLLRWDGTVSDQKEPAEGLFQAVARVIAPTGVGTTKAVSRDVFVTAASCSCDCETKPTGNRKMSCPLNGLPGCPVGPSFNLNLDYCTVNSGKPASSMGFGWQAKSTCRIFEPPGQNGSVSYRSETGTYLRWNLQGSDYVPAFADNYVELVKNASEPIYVLTFQDQSVREFNLEGRLVRERDRNGNPMTCVYDLVTGDLAQMTDATGQSIFFDYSGRTDGQPRYIRALDAVAGRTIELQYDANARLEYVIQNGDGVPEITQFVYNAEGLVETMILPSGLRPVTFVYDIFGRVVVELYTPAATPDGFESVKEIFYEQDAIDLGAYFGLNLGGNNVVASLVTDLTDNASPGRLTFATYDLLGNMVQRDELVFSATPPFDSRFNTTVLEYNDPNNPHLVTRQIMPNGFTLTMTYNVQGNVSSVNESYSDTTMIYRYTEDVDTPPFNPKWRNLLREIHRPTVTVDGVPTTYPPTVFTYEPTYGNLVGVQDAAGKSILMQVSTDGLIEAVTDRRNYTTTMAYHPTSRRLESITTPGGPNGAPSRTTTVTYDAYLNIESITSPTLPGAQFTHDEQNRPKRSTTPLGFYTESSYLNGLLNQVEMPANQGSATLRRQTQLLYDLANRLEQVQAQIDSVSGNPVFELRVGYLYDGLSQLKNLARLKDGALKFTIYNYDLLGRLVHAVDFLNPGRETFKVYADYCTSNLVTTPRGVEREATYDERCRLRQLQTQDETHLFDYDELNRLVRVRMGSRYAWGSPQVGGRYSTGFYAHETAFTYDELDRVVEVRYIKGGVTETVAYSYNENGDVISLRDVQSRTTLYDHYADGRLLSVSFEGQQFTYTHDAAGRLESLTYPTSPDTLVANFIWDDDGRLLSLVYLRNSAPFQSFAYTYDDSGNRVTMTEIDPNSITVNWSYSYDWLNRLTGVSKNGQLVESYTYDESDNRITLTRPLLSEVWEYSYDLADQLESITVSTGGGAPVLRESFVSDQDGNMSSRSESGVFTEYAWDTLNRLRQVTVDGNVILRSLYDAEGIRRLSNDNGGQSKFFSSGGMSLADQRPAGPVSFIQGHQLLGLEQGGGLHFYITDGLGSVRLVVDATGTAEGAFAHDAWGVPDPGATPPGAELQAHSFVGGLGQRNDTASLGLYYARQRYYDPQLGRFLSQDPIGFAGSLNAFGYVNQSPINYVDQEGLNPILIGIIIIGLSRAAGHNPKDHQAEDSWLATASKFNDFVMGEPMRTDFGPRTAASKAMQTDRSRIKRMLKDWVAKNRMRRYNDPNCPLIETVYYPDYNWGLQGGPVQAGINPTKHFVGGYRGCVTPIGDGRVKIKITNTTSVKSLLYDLPFLSGITNPFGASGPFHNQTQDYYWTEDMPNLDSLDY